MTLPPGTRLGPYQVVGSVGAGGMGVVYRARDTRLDRTVAVKVLLPEIAADPSFALRFEREARIISSLNHPRICALHDVGRQDGIDYLVLEFLEGESLATRLIRGPLPLSQTLKYAIEIADALEAAHQRGIIHRDLKPGNIMLTPTGVKLVDFGLARPTGPGAFAMTVETTHAMPSTAIGTFVGTLQYMAPEQIQGRDADARTDIFALGTVIYEMATGKRTFEADTQASLVAKILETEAPPLATLAPLTPSALNHVVDVCLAKQPAERWQTAHDVLLHLRWIQQEGSRASVSLPGTHSRARRWLPWAAAAILTIGVVAAAVGWAMWSRPAETAGPLTRFDMMMPAGMTLPDFGWPAVSPDGQMVVVPAAQRGIAQLYLRRFDDTAFVPLPGTEAARSPFWSPDSRSIAFVSGGKLRRVAVTGGPPTVLAEEASSLGGSWNRDGTILYTATNMRGPIMRVSASGGTPTAATSLDVTKQERGHSHPHFLPDGRRFLFTVGGAEGGIYAGSLDSTTVTRVVRDATGQSIYLPSGHLLFVQQQTLMTVPFDPEQQQTSAMPTLVARQVRAGMFSAAPNGTVVYRPGGDAMIQLAWLARDGRLIKHDGEPGPFRQIVLSPSGRRLAIQQGDPEFKAESEVDLWLMDLTNGVHSRLTTSPGYDGDPAWSPDENTLAFTTKRSGREEVFTKNLVTGAEELLIKLQFQVVIDEWTRDGRFLIVRTIGAGGVYAIPMTGDRTPKLLVNTPFDEDQLHVSPDGKWVVFNTDETGRWEVFLARFPDFALKRQISNAGGVQPFWRQDGRELFYLSPDGTVMAVDIGATEVPQPGVPRALFKTKLTPAPGLHQYSVSGDGQRFLMAEPLTNDYQTMTFVLNWRPPAR
jgi:Tol biopolymer transport system component